MALSRHLIQTRSVVFFCELARKSPHTRRAGWGSCQRLSLLSSHSHLYEPRRNVMLKHSCYYVVLSHPRAPPPQKKTKNPKQKAYYFLAKLREALWGALSPPLLWGRFSVFCVRCWAKPYSRSGRAHHGRMYLLDPALLTPGGRASV